MAEQPRGDFSCKCGLSLKNVALPVHHRCRFHSSVKPVESQFCIYRGKENGTFSCRTCKGQNTFSTYECDIHGTCRLNVLQDDKAPPSTKCSTCAKLKLGYEPLVCDKRIDSICKVASEIAGSPAQTTLLACRQCQQQQDPMTTNPITVTLAIGAAKQAGDQFKASEIISTHRHHLQHPGVGLKELASFSAHSLAWLMNGAPTRTRAERLEILNTCMSCDFYQPESETEGHCRQCKCPISEDAPKLAMKTERCPENKW